MATAMFGAILLSTAALHNLALLCALMLIGGASWTVFMSLFNTMVQNLAPDWVRARVMAAYLFVFQGSVAIGSALWGLAAEHTSVRMALFVSGIGMGASVLLQFAFRLPSTADRSQHLESLGQTEHVRGACHRPWASSGYRQICHRSSEGVRIS